MAAPTLDGSPATGTFTGTSSGTATLTTPSANDVIVVLVGNGSVSGGTLRTVSSVTASGLTFTRRGGATVTYAGLPCNYEIWWAPSALALTSKVITVTLSGAPDDAGIIAFGVNGAHDINSPWDSNSGFTKVTTETTNPNAAVAPVFTTNQANDFIFAASFKAANNNAVTSSWTTLGSVTNGGGTNFAQLRSFYNPVTATQSGVTVPLTQNFQTAIWLCDAITADAASSIETGTGTLAFAGISINGKGSDATGAARVAFSGISIAGAGSSSHFGAGAIAFQGISIAGAGIAEVVGDAGMAFAGISIIGSGIGLAPPGSGLRQFWTF